MSMALTAVPPGAAARPSDIMTMQNGQLVATVSAPVARTCAVRFSLMRVPRVSSIHMRPPPAPQQNVFLPDFSISVIDTPAAPSTSRGAAMMLL